MCIVVISRMMTVDCVSDGSDHDQVTMVMAGVLESTLEVTLEITKRCCKGFQLS